MIFAIITQTDPEFAQQLLDQLDALYRTARYLTQDSMVAEDIVQEVSLKAIQKRHTFRNGSKFRPWIFAILRNTVTDYYRQQGRTPTMVSFEADQVEHPLTEPVDQLLFDYLLAEEIEEALAQLPDEMRLAVLLADVEGFRYKEIAAILEWPMGTVMSRLYRARKKLRGHLLAYAQSRGYQREALK